MSKEQYTRLLGWLAFGALALLLALDVLFFALQYKQRFLVPSLLGMAIVFVFIGFGHRFSEIVVNAKEGITLKEAQQKFESISDLIDLLYSQGSRQYLDRLLAVAAKIDEPWLQLLLYRIMMRAILYRKSKNEQYALTDAPSIQWMGDKLLESGKISDQENATIKSFSENTYYAEWGMGSKPRMPIDELLAQCPKTLRAIHTTLGL